MLNDYENTNEYFGLVKSKINGDTIDREILDISELNLDNDKTIAFYKGAGYDVFYEFTSYPSRKMLRMNKRLNK